MLAFEAVKPQSILDLYCRTVASVLVGNSNGFQLRSVTADGVFLCYESVKAGKFPTANTTVILFGLSEVCTLQSCLEICNRTFAELFVPTNEQKIQLYLCSSISFPMALLFFKEHGYEYEMSCGGDDVTENVFLRRVVPKLNFVQKIRQLMGV